MENLLQQLISEVLRAELISELKLVGDVSAVSKSLYRVVELYNDDDTSSGQFMFVSDVSKLSWDLNRQINKDFGLTIRNEQSLVVDHNKQNIDLDITKFRDEMSRRNGNNSSKSYTIPHGGVSFDNESKLKKMLKAIMRYDVSVTKDYVFVGNPKYDGMTISNVLKMTTPGDNAVSGASFKPMKLYHGTSKKRYEQIKKNGLIPNKTPETYSDLIPDYSDKNIYLTTSVSKAESYATRAAITDRSMAVVVSVIIRDPTRLVLDEDNATWLHDVDVPPDARRLFKNTTTMKANDWKTDIHFADLHWRKWSNADKIMQIYQSRMASALNKNHTVGYRGKIPVSDIKLIAQYKPVSMQHDPTSEEFDLAMEKTRKSYKRS